MVLLTSGPSAFDDLADEIAATRDDRVVTDLGDVAASESVVYVGSASTISDGVLLDLQKRLLADGSDDGAFSVVTGHDADRARDLYYREGDCANDHALLLQKSSDLSVPADDDAAVHVDDDVSTATVRELCERKPASLNFNASAWPIHVNLSDGFICGYPESIDVSEYEGRQPFCVEEGARQCPLADDEDLVPAEQLAGSHVFFASCGSMIDNITTSVPVHVGLGLLDGAESLIGSYRPGPSLPYETLFHYSLLRAGYDLNERTYLLNVNSNVNGVMETPYVPFGRPDSRIDPDPEPSFSLSEVDGRDVLLEDIDGHVVDFTIPADGVPNADDRLYVRNLGEAITETPLYYLAFEDGEEVRVLLYTGSRMDVDSLHLRIDAELMANDRREVATAALENGELFRRIDMLDQKAEKQLLNLRKQLHNLQEPTEKEGHRVDVHHESTRQIDSLFGDLRALEGGLVEDLSDGYPERYQYASRSEDDDVFVADFDCHGCGRNVFIKQVSVGANAAKRALGECAYCGYIFDVPTEDGDREPTYPVPSGDLWGTDERYRDLTVRFSNPTDNHMRATFLPTLLRVGTETPSGDQIFDPETVTRTLAPGQEVEVEFTIDAASVKEMQHYLRVTVLGNLQIYTGEELFLVGDDTGYVHPNHW